MQSQSRCAAAYAVALSCWTMSAHAAPNSAESVSEPSSRTFLGITIYSGADALVRDRRTVVLPGGLQRLQWREVAATIRPETVSLHPVAGGPFDRLEQSFEFDLLTPAALLHKYLGRQVTVIRINPATGAETSEPATVLADNDGVVLRYRDRIETGLGGRLSFPDVPANLYDRPTLSWLLQVPQAGERQVELTYLAAHVGWKADYIATVEPDARAMRLEGWVTLTNQSGTAYENARLQLVAGTLHRAAQAAPAASPAPMTVRLEQVAEEKLGDYHLYTLPHPTTIENNQTKQVALLTATGIPVRREYVLQGNEFEGWYRNRQTDMRKGLKPDVYIRFENKGGELGIPLPAGVVRAYMPDRSGGVQFVGEDAMAHTAKGEEVSLRVGQAFDLTADRVQTDFQQVNKRTAQSSYRIELRNGDSKPADVLVREGLRDDWKITSESLPHTKESASSAVWSVTVPANGKAVLEYTAVVSW